MYAITKNPGLQTLQDGHELENTAKEIQQGNGSNLYDGDEIPAVRFYTNLNLLPLPESANSHTKQAFSYVWHLNFKVRGPQKKHAIDHIIED